MKDLIPCAALLLLLSAPSWAAGQASPLAIGDKQEPPAVKLVLYPAAEPRPALRYQLLPPMLDRRPGNAAVLYNKAIAERSGLWKMMFDRGGSWEKIEKWLEVPLNDPREAEMRKSLSDPRQWHSFFDDLDRAARCESCDWQLPLREQEFFSILLPELQQTRNYARLLTTKARFEIAEGKFDDALHTLQTSYALARHVGQGQTLIHGLVGLANSAMMSKRVEDWGQQPNAPNLYWALTWLPRPLIDFRSGLEAEMNMIYLSYPELRNLESAKYSAEQWREMLEKTVDRVLRWSDGRGEVPRTLVSTAAALRGYPMAKRALIAWGRPAAEVEAMPVAQVIMVYTMRTYEELRDDIFKWFAVPHPEGRAGAAAAEQSLQSASREWREALPIARVVLPAIESARFAEVRGERTIAMLRIVEAIRLYGAAHERRLPDELTEIKDVPVPADPVTGKAFLYHHTYGKAILESPPVPGKPQKDFGVRYEIQFAEKGK
jgi:hypothetical protein